MKGLIFGAIWAALVAPVVAQPASAQVVVAASDGKQILVDGAQLVPQHPAPDAVSVLTLKNGKPHIVKTMHAPTSVIGPPCSVAISPDGRYAIVSAARKVAADPTQIEPDDTVTVIALTGKIRVVQTTKAGAGASGVAFSPDGTRVLIANRAEGTVSLFRFAKGQLTALDTLDLGNINASPAAVLIFAKGEKALLTRDGDNQVSLLSLHGDKLTLDPQPVLSEPRPYEVTSGRDRRYAVVGAVGGNGKVADSITLIDLAGDRPIVVDTQVAGLTDEGVRMSPDGRYVAVTLDNGTNLLRTAPTYHTTSELQVWRIEGGKLNKVTSTQMGSWAQGAAWSRDSKTLLAESMDTGTVEVFGFDGKTLTHQSDLALPTGAAAIAADQ